MEGLGGLERGWLSLCLAFSVRVDVFGLIARLWAAWGTSEGRKVGCYLSGSVRCWSVGPELEVPAYDSLLPRPSSGIRPGAFSRP
jgi:hypothetical protein